MRPDPIESAFAGHARAFSAFANPNGKKALRKAAQLLLTTFKKGRKVLVCGNGGSAADAEHFVGELVGKFVGKKRPALPAIALTANTATLTSIGNDFGFEYIFARQIEALGRSGDCLIAITTSGRSKNVRAGLAAARKKRMTTVLLTGAGGSALARAATAAIIVPSKDTQRIQEMHELAIHAMCAVLEDALG